MHASKVWHGDHLWSLSFGAFWCDVTVGRKWGSGWCTQDWVPINNSTLTRSHLVPIPPKGIETSKGEIRTDVWVAF